MLTTKLKHIILTAFVLSCNSFANEGFSTVNNAQNSKAQKNIEKHTLDGSAEIGFGYESNLYLTPNNAYNDYTRTSIKTGNTLVIPTVKSGMFVPLSLKADYEYRYKKDIRFLGGIKLDGKYFSDKDLTNANQHKTLAEAGARYRINRYKKEINKFELIAFGGDVHKIYVDRDDGLPKTTTKGDQSNRYQYKKIGAELSYTYDYKKLDIYLRALQEKRDYATPATWTQLDHTHTRVKLQGGYKLSKELHLGAYYEHIIRDYTERKSYEIDATGKISLVKPGMVLTYNDIKVYGDYRFSKNYKISLKYLLSNRQDDNQGYADYSYHLASLLNSYKFSKTLRSSLELKYFLYDYKNAHAYDNDTTYPEKKTQGYEFNLSTKYKISKDLISSLDIEYRAETSTDKRYEYNNTTAVLNLKYLF